MTGPEPLVAVPGQLKCVLGGVLLSRTLAGAVPSALSGLASGFGMGAGRVPCRCDHRDVWYGQCSAVLSRVVDSVIGRPLPPSPCVWCGWGVGWVWTV